MRRHLAPLRRAWQRDPVDVVLGGVAAALCVALLAVLAYLVRSLGSVC